MLQKINTLASAAFGTALLALPKLLQAQGIGGMSEIQGYEGGEAAVQTTVRNLLFRVVSYVGLAGVVMIVIAGIIFVVAGSNESMREKAKNTIIYVAVGILVIGLAAAFVLFIQSLIV